jgi:hypothetical protein
MHIQYLHTLLVIFLLGGATFVRSRDGSFDRWVDHEAFHVGMHLSRVLSTALLGE